RGLSVVAGGGGEAIRRAVVVRAPALLPTAATREVHDAADRQITATGRGERAPAARRLTDEHDALGIDRRTHAEIRDGGRDVLRGLEPRVREVRARTRAELLFPRAARLAVPTTHRIQHDEAPLHEHRARGRVLRRVADPFRGRAGRAV